jgi:hypothetical protein
MARIAIDDDYGGFTISSVPGIREWMQVAHLAYGQGTPNTANAQYIMYNRVGVEFSSGQKPKLWLSPTEHVSEALAGCGWLHPSIAVDSLRIGVSFQTNRWDDRLVTLRFRNTTNLDTIGNWRTIAYNWGATQYSSLMQYYEWPSLTQFPATPKNQLQSSGQGALTWFRTKRAFTPASKSPSWQYIYRYGDRTATRLPDGQYPTMMLAPYRKQNPIEFTSVLHRGDTSTRETRQSPRGAYNTSYYPPLLQTKRTAPSGIFGGKAVSDSIIAEFTIEPKGKLFGCGPYFTAGFDFLWDDDCDCTGEVSDVGKIGWDDRDDKPPFFFSTVTGYEKEVWTLADAAEVTRTSTFPAGGQPMVFKRSYAGGIDMMAWLNGVPPDSNFQQADIKLLMELVRDSDNVVLWSADTISARDVGYDVVNELVEIPVHTVTPSLPVYVRIRALTSYTLEYDVSAGFTTWEDSTLNTYYKVNRPRTEEKPRTGEIPSPLEVNVIPNPLTVRGELWLRVTEPGRTSVGIYDMLGRLVKELPAFDATHPGEYAMELDLVELPKGTYTVRIEQGSYQASSRFTVMR